MTMMLMLVAGGGKRLWLNSPISAFRANNGTPGSPAAGPVSVGFQVANTGVLNRCQTTSAISWVATADGWLTGAAVSAYDVRFTKVSGAAATMAGSATPGTWYNLATSRHVGYSLGGGEGSVVGVWTIDIALATDHTTILATTSATIEGDSNEFNP